MRVLALSSSRVGNGDYLASAVSTINNFLGNEALQIAFIPFASADEDYEGYANKVREGLSSLPHTIHVARPANAKTVIEEADVIMVGGGNTFKLLHDIYRYELFVPIQKKVRGDAPYIGWSAGANLAGKTICTTNDMPVIQPESFTAFGFLPFQINPHYYNVVIEGFNGETRDQRLTEFLLLNPGVPVIGLPEGTALLLNDGDLQFLGQQNGVLFQYDKGNTALAKQVVSPGYPLSFLL